MHSGGLVFRVLPDGESATLVSWYGDRLEGDVVVPSRVASGADSYAVTGLGVADAEGRCEGAFKDSDVESVTLPATVETVVDGALSDCPSLKRILVSDENEALASSDGMLFSKDLTSLLFVPEGKEGTARIPDSTESVPASAFSRCERLQKVEVGEGIAFSSRNGILYTKDLKTLIACPPGIGSSAVIAAEAEAVGESAFAGCELESITVLGDVRSIAPDAFEAESKGALVALPSGEGYDGRKAVWEAAGFSRFSEPAKPGDVSEPEAPEAPESPDPDAPEAPSTDGLAFELLDDYTLSVSWAGKGEAPSTLSIPASAEVGGASYRVSAIAPAGFANLASLESVELPAGLSAIGDAAFAGCAKLASAPIPDGASSIGERAFEATAITEAWIPASVESVGPRAFAACPSLSRVVALGAPEAAADALAECAGVSVYCPSGSEGAWNPGLPAAGNHVLPFGAELSSEPLALAAGEEADLMEGGSVLAPEPVAATFSYAARPVSVEGGTVAGKAEGATDVAVVLTLDGEELARASRPVEVSPSPDGEQAVPMVNETAQLLPSAYLAGERAAAVNVTAPIAVTFGGSGYDVSNPANSLTASATFQNNSATTALVTGLTCTDAGASDILEASSGAAALGSQKLFSLYPGMATAKAADFGYGSGVNTATLASDAFSIAAGGTLDCTYRLNLGSAKVKATAADGGAKVQPLAKVSYEFAAIDLGAGTGSTSAAFYLKDNTTGKVYTAAEVRKHADAIASGDAGMKAAYEAFMADEDAYECKTTWGGVPYDVRVIGINHDDKSDGSGKAGLTFQFKNLLNTKYRMNPTNDNSGGWGSSDLRTLMNSGDIWTSVPSDLRSAIAPVKKYYGADRNSTAATVATSDDSLFVASYRELSNTLYAGSTAWANAAWLGAEGAQYEYWQNKVPNDYGGNASLVKGLQASSASAADWWERSVRPDNSMNFLGVTGGGDPSNNYNSAGTPLGVCPCFCL